MLWTFLALVDSITHQTRKLRPPSSTEKNPENIFSAREAGKYLTAAAAAHHYCLPAGTICKTSAIAGLSATCVAS